MKIEKKIYKARTGAPFPGTEAQVIGEHLEKNSLYTPPEIVKNAESPESPLHNLFEWDDTEAAREYRLQQARGIINHIEVEIVYEGGETQYFDRGFEFVHDNGSTRYLPVEEGLSDTEYRKQILARAWETLKGWQERYGNYNEFKPIVKAIELVEPVIEKEVISVGQNP